MLITPVLFLLFLQPPTEATPSLAEVRERLKKTDAATVSEMIQLAGRDSRAAVRKAIVDRLGRLNRPEVRALLERHAAQDADAEVSVLALEKLRQLQGQDLAQLFEKRLETARQRGESAELASLRAEHQHWAGIGRGATIPKYMETPPPVFEAARGQRVRVVGFGDFGEESEGQKAVAQAIAAAHAKQKFDLGLTLGDNVVPVGVTGPDDTRWKNGWESLYDGLGLKFYAVTGNHDWGLADSPAAEIEYGRKSPSWRMPALYYTFTAGPAQFFAVCTHAMSETQARWLDGELSRSKAKWKIVYGHHPIYSAGAHGDTPALEKLLLPVIRGRAQVYLAGHEHLMQELQAVGGTHLMVAPSAGQKPRDIQKGPRTVAADSFFGYVTMEIDAQALTVRFHDTTGKTRYETTLR